MEHGGPNADTIAVAKAGGNPVDFKTIDWQGANDTPGCDYSSVAFWYQAEPHGNFAPMPSVDKRIPGPQM